MTLKNKFVVRLTLFRVFILSKLRINIEVIMPSVKSNDRRSCTYCSGDQEYFQKSFISDLKKQIKQQKWPCANSIFLLKKKLTFLQKKICCLSLVNKNEEALFLVEKYTFNIGVRIFIITNIKKKKLLSLKTCLYLLHVTKWTHFLKWAKITFCSTCIRCSGVASLLDWILQAAFVALMTPYYEAKLPVDCYGCRKGRSAIQAVARIKYILEKKVNQPLGIFVLSIENFFTNLNHRAILKRFSHPLKFRKLLWRWLTVRIVKHRLNMRAFCLKQGIINNSFLSPLLCNVLLAQVVSSFILFKNLKNYFTVFLSYKRRTVYRYVISYLTNIIILTTQPKELAIIHFFVKRSLLQIGLTLLEKTIKPFCSTSFNTKIKFNYLGFTFYYVPVLKLRIGGVLHKKSWITTKKKMQKNSVLLYISVKSFKKIKRDIQIIVKKLTRKNLQTILLLLTSTIRKYIIYFCWSGVYTRFKMLGGFLFINLKKYLIKKYRFRGLRRPTWVTKTFLSTKTSALKLYDLLYNKFWALQPTFNSVQKIFWLCYPTKNIKFISLLTVICPAVLWNKPYFLYKYLYFKYWQTIKTKREQKKSCCNAFFLLQKKKCSRCFLPFVGLNDDFFLREIKNLS